MSVMYGRCVRLISRTGDTNRMLGEQLQYGLFSKYCGSYLQLVDNFRNQLTVNYCAIFRDEGGSRGRRLR